jgi:type I restriction enzyme S subunit
MDLPKNWLITSFGDVLTVKNGFAFKSTEYQSEGIPIVRISDINEGIVNVSNSKCISENYELDSYSVNTGDILIAMSGATTGKFGIYNGSRKVYQNQRVGNLKPISENHINKKFVYYLLYSLKREIEKAAYGGAQPNISGSKIEQLEIPLPPLPEQHRIVTKIEELFSELDKGIESLKTAQQQLKIYRQSLLKHAFSGKLTEQWRADNQDKLETADALLARIQSEREERYQELLTNWEDNGRQGTKPKAPKVMPPLTDEELAELPDGWGWTRLGCLIDEPTYGTSKKCDYEIDGIGVLRIPNIVSGKIDASDLKFAQFDDGEIATYRLNDDILLIRSNGSISIVGRCALVSSNDIKYLYAGYLIMLRPNKRIISPAYLIEFFSAHSLRKQIEHKAKSTSGVNNINSGEIQSLVVAVCGIKEQNEIKNQLESRLSRVDRLEQTIITALQQSEVLRQSILKKAFSGLLVPQDPNDEPASVLLERIKAEKAALINPTIKKTKSGKKTST